MHDQEASGFIQTDHQNLKEGELGYENAFAPEPGANLLGHGTVPGAYPREKPANAETQGFSQGMKHFGICS
jgi:hypothetical protein